MHEYALYMSSILDKAMEHYATHSRERWEFWMLWDLELTRAVRTITGGVYKRTVFVRFGGALVGQPHQAKIPHGLQSRGHMSVQSLCQD